MPKKPLMLAALALSCLWCWSAAAIAGAAESQGSQAGGVDLRCAPAEWQSAICFPDDPHKSLVDKSGTLLYRYGGRAREFGTRVSLEVASNAVWESQTLFAPRVPIVQTFRRAGPLRIEEEAFAVAGLEKQVKPTAANQMRSGPREPGPRNDVVLVHVINTGNEPQTVAPRLIVDTDAQFAQIGDRVVLGNHETVTSSLRMMSAAPETNTGRHYVQLASMTVPANRRVDFSITYSAGGRIVCSPQTIKEARSARDRAVSWWKHASLPYDHITVPDPGIQGLLDSSIRNIWQAREIKGGLPVFQVGPTCYRGLWIVDGAFLLESAAILGAGKEARNAIVYTLSQQKPSGAFEVLSPQYYKENGIVIWTCVRHALLTQDKAWLASVWPQLERAAHYIQDLRRRSLEDDNPLDDGLNPPGEIDGGLSGHRYGFKRPEFSNVYWNLTGLHALVQAAHWLGNESAATAWEREYADLCATFRRATQRDLLHDAKGNAYVPIFMGDAGHELPQRAQWVFCHGVYPGQIFAQDDPLVSGTLAMLQATEREGMVFGTGWDATGIWNYFASFYGHAWLWQGNGRKAADVLYAYANHAAPVLDWREEQSLKGAPFRKVGDMPHNWASAEFIRLTVHLLALDRGDELHLLEGLPRQWLGPGMTSRLDGIATPFGPLRMKLQVDARGRTATLTTHPLAANCKAVVVHLPGGGVRRIDPARGGQVRFALGHPVGPDH